MNLKGLNKLDVEYLRDWEIKVHAAHGLSGAEAFLFRHSVMRVFANETRDQGRRLAGDGWFDPTPTNAQVQHIVDWLRADLYVGAPWLQNVDEHGRPRKLMKCRSIEDMMREADKAMDRRNGGRRAKALGPDDESFVAELGNGFTLVRLLTPAALDLESDRMHHCVGHGGYDYPLYHDLCRVLSVRDRKGRPQATVELRPIERVGSGVYEVRQIQGRRNMRPPREVMDALRVYVVAQDWHDRQCWWPVVELEGGSECDIDRIPEGATIREIPLLSEVRNLYPDFTLPAGLTVLSGVTLSPLTMVPERLFVQGTLAFTRRIGGDPLIRLPESLDAAEVRVGSLEDLAQPIPAHLVDRIRYRIWTPTGYAWSDPPGDEEDEPETPRP